MAQATTSLSGQPSSAGVAASAAPLSQTRISFTEEMKGYVTFGETDYDRGFRQGKKDNNFFMFHLAITAEDVTRFVTDRRHEATAVGWVRCPILGKDMAVEKGIFNLFTDEAGPLLKHMSYRLFFTHEKEGKLTMSGFKVIQDDREHDVWHDTTTLFTRLYRGHVTAEEEQTAAVFAAGIIQIYFFDFMKQLTTIRTEGPTARERNEAREKFSGLFFGSLWEVYGVREALGQKPAILVKEYAGGEDHSERVIPLYTHEGVKNAAHETISFNTEDKLGLSFERFTRAETDDVVMIIHGLTTSTDMFIMPEHYNLVSYLLDNGFTDVWSLDFRMSNRHNYNLATHRMTMDDIALFDYPAALQTMRERIGP